MKANKQIHLGLIMVLTLWVGSITALSQSLIGYWNFDEQAPGTPVGTAANSVLDSSPSYTGIGDTTAHHGTPSGALQYVAPVFPGFGSAIDFNGANNNEIQITGGVEDDFDFIYAAAQPGTTFVPTPGQFTMSLRVNARALSSNWQAVMSKGEQNAWRIADQNNIGGLNYSVQAGIGQDMTNGTQNFNQWYHLVVVRESRGAKGFASLYVDGDRTTDATALNLLDNDIHPMVIGDNTEANNRNWNGQIDDVAIWNGPLECFKPQAIYHAAVDLGYTVNEMIALFDAYDNQGSVTITSPSSGETLTWDYVATGLSTEGDISFTTLGNFIQIGDDGSGLRTTREAPILSLTKTASSDEVTPGTAVTFDILYQNSGLGEVTDPMFTDTLSPGFVFQSPAHNFNQVIALNPAGVPTPVNLTVVQTGNQITWSLPSGWSLAGPGTIQFQVFAEADTNQTTTYRCLDNTIDIAGNDAPINMPVSASATAEVVSILPDVAIAKTVANITSGAATAARGDLLEYTVTISNSAAQAGLVLTDSITGGTFVPGSVMAGGATINMTPTSLELTWPPSMGNCVQTVGEHGADEFVGGFNIDDPNYPSPIIGSGDPTTFDPVLTPLGVNRLFFHASDWFGSSYTWDNNGGSDLNLDFNNGGGTVGSVAIVCDEAAAWVAEDRMAVFTGAGGFTQPSLSGNGMSSNNQKTFVWHFSPQSLSNGRQVVYETGGAGTGTSLVLIDSRLYWTANFNPDFGQAMVDLSTIDYDPLVDFIRVVAVIVKNSGTPFVSLGAYNRCGQGVTDLQAIQDPNGNGLALGNWAGGNGAGLGINNAGLGADQGARVSGLEGGGAFGNYIGAIANMAIFNNGANLPVPAPTSATCDCDDGKGYRGDGAISTGYTDPCWLTTTVFSRDDTYNHNDQNAMEDLLRQGKSHPEYGSSGSGFTEFVDFSESNIAGSFTPQSPPPGLNNNGNPEQFSVYSRGYILIDDAAPGGSPYTFQVRHDDGSRLYIDGVQVYSTAGNTTTTASATLNNGLHYVEVMLGENTGGDVIELAVMGADGLELLTLADTVVYTTRVVTACSTLAQWGKLQVESVANNGYVAVEVLDASGAVLIGSMTNVTEVDLSTIPVSNSELILRFTLENEGCFSEEGPLLEGWDASYICDDCVSVTTVTYQVMVDECIANVASVDNSAEISTPDSESSITNNTAMTSTPLGPFYNLAVNVGATAASPPANAFFSVTVMNTGSITSDVAMIDSVIGSSVTIASIPAGCTMSGNTISCALPAFAPGAGTNFNIEVESGCCAIGAAVITATVVALCSDENPFNDSDTAQLNLPGDTLEPVVTVEPPDVAGICNVQPMPPLQATAILDIFNASGVDISLLPTVPTGMAEGTDTCSVVTSYVDQATVFGCVANIVRTWTFLDECGLSTTYDQDINITLDTTPPVITADPTSPTMAVCLGGPITDEWTAGAMVTDDCDPAPAVTFTNVSVATACGEIVTRTWTAVDACGNTATVDQVFENLFNDTAGPTITPPADVAGCNMDTSPAAQGVALSSDDCVAATTPADCLVVNGDFENGDLLGWSLNSTGTGTFRINDGVFDPTGPTPATAACNGGFSAVNEQMGPGIRQMWQDVGIPAAPSATLNWTDEIFNNAAAFADPGQEYRVLIQDPATGTTLATAFSTTPGDALIQPCATRSFDITPFAGQTIRIMFEVEDSASALNVYIDDVCIDVNPVTPTFADTITMVGCTQMIERVWTSSDACGNTASATQIIENVLDTTPPVLTLPPDTNGCAIATTVAANGSATAVDACGTVTVTNSDEIVMQGDNTIVLRTWTATDACGNETEGLQTIISLDVFGGPVVTVPPNTTACNGATNMAATGMAMITAGCCATGTVTVTVADVVTAGAAACEEMITRTWTASDDCGNTSSASQIITNYVDMTPPVIVIPAPVALCNGFTNPASVGMATATDDCLLVTNTWMDNVTQANCLETIERVWTAVDFCGNVAVATQLISNVADADAPTLTVPADTNGCNISTNTADTGVATATDACGTTTVAFVNTVTIQDCVQTVFREWTATDECGASTSAIQVISVVLDTAGPTLILPADTAGCNLDTSVNAIGAASATDDCAAPTIAWSDMTNTIGCVVTISRLWSATDDCGNMSTGVQTIVSTVDTDAPVLTVPADVSQCNLPDTTPATTGMGSAADVCGAATTTWSDVVLTTPCSTIIERTWTATDDCGNSTSGVQQIENIADTTGPTFTSIPADVDLCMDDTTPANTGMAEATDACGTTTVMMADTVVPQPKGDLIERVWTATDPCGNAASVTQLVFNYTSTTPPPITIPPDVDACNIQTPAVFNGLATSTDPEAVITHSDTEQIVGCTRVIIRTWTATDACLSSSGTQLVQNTIDVSAPTIYVPDPVRLCNPAATDPSVAGMPRIIETCSAPTVSWSDVTNVVSACAEEITRTWVAVDGCGNSNSADQVITVVNDNGAPVLSGIPVDVFACNTGSSAEALAGPDPVITDDCMTMIEVGDDILITNCMYRLIRTWMVVDECGNATSVSQTVILQSDTVAPVLTVPASTNVCNATDLSPAALGMASAVDGCTPATVAFTDVAVTSGCQVVITRTWTATDLCNNVAESDQIIVNTSDTEAPTWDFFPADTNVCNVASIDPLLGTPTAVDNCNVTVELTDETSELINCEFIVTRTWTASDDCGNSIVRAQTVVSQADLNGPTITLPPDVEGCNMADTSPAAAGVATAVDGCSTASVTWTDVTNTTGCAVIITRTWSAVDGCDQISTADQIIMDVVDNASPPVITVADESYCIIGNGPAPDSAPATALDDCGTATLTSTTASSVNGCIETVTITWTATDACGNSDSVDQTISIERDTSFGWDISAAVDAMGCNLDTSSAAAGEPVVSSDCGVTATFADDVTTADCIDTIVRTWTVIDICGGEYVHTQTLVSVVDTDAPGLVPPADESGCNLDTSPGQPTVSDDCSEVSVTHSDAVTTTDCTTTILRTWTATDACGNSTSAVQTIETVVDAQPPALAIPANVSGCGISTDAADTGTATATDACGTAVITSEDTVSQVGVVVTITRTWTAMDDCGNEAVDVQTIVNIDDNTPPVIDTPADIAGCNLFLTNAAALATASDNSGGNVTVSFSDTTNASGCIVTIERTWMAADECGNMSTSPQSIVNTLDLDPPMLTVPADMSGCNIPTGPGSTGEATATDNCNVTVTFNDSTAQNGCEVIITRTWTATDDCGQAVSGVQMIRVTSDTTAPTLTCPADLAVLPNANGDLVVPDLAAMVSMSDDCRTTLTQTPAAGTVFGNVDIDNFQASATVSLVAVDGCGNETVCEVAVRNVSCIGDLIFNDLNSNGAFDVGEPGVPNIMVTIADTSGIIGTTITDADGRYLFFMDAAAGTAVARGTAVGGPYTVTATLPDGGQESTTVASLQPGQHVTTADIPITLNATITGTVWRDLNADGDPSNENLASTGLGGIEVNLYDPSSNLVATTTTNPDGSYSFVDVVPGDYTVGIGAASLPASLDTAGISLTSMSFNVPSGATVSPPQANFGFIGTPTAVGLESISASEGTLRWTVADEAGILGYNIIDLATGAAVNEALILAGSGAYSLDVGPGNYALESLDSNLNTDREAEVTQYEEADASPLGEPTKFIAALNGSASFTTDAGTSSYLVTGVGPNSLVLDLSDPNHPVRLIGEVLRTDSGIGVYFSYPAGATIEVK